MNNREIDDQTLISTYLQGNEEGFSMLYERYKGLLYSYLNRMLPNDPAKADDLFQQTWIKAIDRLSSYEHRQQFGSWLLRIAHNLTIDCFRKNKRMAQYEAGSRDDPDFSHADPADTGNEPWQRMHRQEIMKALKQALDQLSPEMREVFLLRKENISFKEIAEIQKCSINTVLSRMQYALKNMRNILTSWKS